MDWFYCLTACHAIARGSISPKKKSFSSQSSEQRLENDKISKGEFSGPVVIRENIWSWFGKFNKDFTEKWLLSLGIFPWSSTTLKIIPLNTAF